MSPTLLKRELRKYASKERKKSNEWFFKTKKGQYGYGDKFIGVTVPDSRKVAKQFWDMTLTDISKLLKSKIHEERLVALFILVGKYKKSETKEKEYIAKFYLQHTKYVNNWDLVDSSASYILGQYLLDKDRSVLYTLAHSNDLWKKRIAIIATAAFIDDGQYRDTLEVAKLLLNDSHDLIHKAVGWMLREVGKRDQKTEEKFLKTHYKNMPRTMLRYAIEKFPEKRRKAYLKGKI